MPNGGMNRTTHGSAVLAVALVVGGCASVLVPQEEILASNARYAELERLVASEITDIRTAPTSRLFYLCTAYGKLKEYNRLFPCADQLEANIARGDVEAGMSDQSPAPHLLRAEAHIELANYAEAVKQAEMAFAIAKRSYQTFARRQVAALTFLGLAQALSNDTAAALQTARRLETEYEPEWFDRERFAGIAKIYIAAGRYAEALRIMQQIPSVKSGFVIGLTQALAGGAPFAFMELPQDFILAKAQFETGHVREAAEGYRKLLANPAVSSLGEIYWAILFDLGRIADMDGKRDEALGRYREAVRVIERQRSTINSMASKIGFVGNKQVVYGHLIADLAAAGRTAEAFEYAERAKSRALVDLLAGRNDFAAGAVHHDRVRTILAELQATERSTDAEDAGATPAERQRRSARSVAIREELQRIAPELATLVTVQAPAAGDIQKMLPPDTTLIEYYYQSERELYAFVLTRSRATVIKLDGSDLFQLVEGLRGAFEDPGKRDYAMWAAKAYRQLLAPVAGQLETSRLIIVPHGVLHYLPFAALWDGRRAVIDRWSVRYLPSASVMRYLPPPRSVGQARLLAIGNPDLGRADLALKYAQREAEELGRLYPDATILTGKQANKKDVVRIAPAFRYVHLATHGRFDSQAPLKSGVFLGGPSLDEGALTVGEMYSLHLNADLVTLSACETGLGKVNSGDDVVGLTQGLLYAGARSIVASLWPVDDEATLYLMLEFYRNLGHASPEDALRIAQLSTRQKYPHPMFWSAFQLTGAGGPPPAR